MVHLCSPHLFIHQLQFKVLLLLRSLRNTRHTGWPVMNTRLRLLVLGCTSADWILLVTSHMLSSGSAFQLAEISMKGRMKMHSCPALTFTILNMSQRSSIIILLSGNRRRSKTMASIGRLTSILLWMPDPSPVHKHRSNVRVVNSMKV